jgi:predicted anti-sigma-YlaC factor YlaD
MRIFSNLIGILHGRCDHAMMMVSRRLDTKLSPASRARLWFHLKTCQACELAARQLGDIHASHQSAPQEEAPARLDPEARARIRARLGGDKPH